MRPVVQSRLRSGPSSLAALGLLVTTIAAGQQTTPPPAPDRAAAERIAANNKLPDPPGTGPYAAMKEEVASLPKHVVYRPANLAALGGRKLGVVAWGNGGCSDDGASTRFHLLEIASHGYLVIANGKILSGPGAPAPRAASADAAESAAGRAHARLRPDRRDRLGARGKRARRQPLLRAHRSCARCGVRVGVAAAFRRWRSPRIRA